MDYMLNNEWDAILRSEFENDYFKKIVEFVEGEYRDFAVYPPKEKIFAALKYTDYNDVKVCILGQDPYHGAGQANGMAFAVENGVRFPPSLNNIFNELKSDLNIIPPKNGSLLGWAKQGVLLLNTCLTVRDSMPQSHEKIGWQRFTDAVITALSKRADSVVFILWGASAIAKSDLISGRHLILSSAHPSPLSASRGFFGSKPFSKTNDFLAKNGKRAIDWSDFDDSRASYYKGSGVVFKV